nr:reverse transcriptase domain-containing protein [Tanacetum cinerariifolium]
MGNGWAAGLGDGFDEPIPITYGFHAYARDFLGTAPSYTSIRDLMLRLCHSEIACNITGISQTPEKVAAAGTPEAVEDASIVYEGVLAVPAPVQAPQPPPPTAGPARTMAHRLVRVEEDVYEIRGELGEQRENKPGSKFSTTDRWAWERYKDLLRACPHYDFTELHQLDTFYNALNPADQDSLNAATGGNLLEKVLKMLNQQTSVVTTAMTAMLKQFQSNPPPAQVKAVEEICVTCGGAHPYYQCLAAGGNTFLEYQDNIHGYVLAAAGNYNQGNPGYCPQGVANQMRPPGFGQPNNFHLNELEKIKRMNDVSLKSMQNQIDMVKNELRNEMKTSIQTSLSNQTNEIKNMMACLLQMNTAFTSGGLATDGPTVPNPPKSINPEEDECVEETYMDPDHAEYTIKVPPLLQSKNLSLQFKETLFCILGTLFHRISPVILKKLPEKLGDPGKFLIPCGFSELKCKALAGLGASINLMPLSVWKKLGLPDMIPTRMTLDLANRAICTPDGIVRDVFVPVGKFTFLADFVVVDYESDPKVPLILGRPFLRTARALINVYSEEMILRDGDERLTLNMKHDTASYSNHPHRDSVNLINIFNISRMYFLSEELPDIDSFNDIHPHFDDDSLSGSTTYSANSLLEEFADELALITYHPDYDDNIACDIESDIREIEFLLYQGKDSDFKDSIDQSVLANYDDLFVDLTPKIFTVEQPPDYSFPPRFDVDDVLPSPDNENKVFNPGIIIHDKSVKIITCVAQEKKLAVSYASLLFKDFDPPIYEVLVFKEVPNSMSLLPFSSENEEKVFKQGIYISKKFHCCFLPELSHPGLPDLIPTRMTLELANRAICTLDEIARDVFVPVGKFTFSADFVVVDYESDPRVPIILGRPFLRTARALIDVHGEEMILRDGNERLTLNMKHETASYSNHPYRDSVNLINILNLSTKDCLKDLVSNKQSGGNPTFSLHKEIASPKVVPEIHNSKGCTFLSEELPDIDSFNDIHPYF